MCWSGCFLLQMTAPTLTRLATRGTCLSLGLATGCTLAQSGVTSIPAQAPVGAQAGLPLPNNPLYNLSPLSGWPALGHMSISGPITGAREMKCADWLQLGHMVHCAFKLHIIRRRERQCPQPQLECCDQGGENFLLSQ